MARQSLQEVLASGLRGPATFDADGTLWSGDVGLGFFHWMLRGGFYPRPMLPGLEEAWAGFKAGTFPGDKLYELMVTGMAGLLEKDVQKLADLYFKRVYCHRIYRPMLHLVEAMQQNGFTPWVVSGSPIWVVAAGASHFGIERDHVIGLRTQVDADGRLTDKLVRPVPWQQGKRRAIRQWIGQRPVFAAGDSLGDKQMLELATYRLVVNPKASLRPAIAGKNWPVLSLGRDDRFNDPRWSSSRGSGRYSGSGSARTSSMRRISALSRR